MFNWVSTTTPDSCPPDIFPVAMPPPCTSEDLWSPPSLPGLSESPHHCPFILCTNHLSVRILWVMLSKTLLKSRQTISTVLHWSTRTVISSQRTSLWWSTFRILLIIFLSLYYSMLLWIVSTFPYINLLWSTFNNFTSDSQRMYPQMISFTVFSFS